MPFSKETLNFLVENRLNDSRSWFHEHNKEYRSLVLQPLQELVLSLTPAMLEIDGEFITEPRVDKTISRIWRDTRYTHDPSLYRENMWIIFKRGRMHTTEFPGIYFEITQDGFGYGCGFYHASTSYMNTLRKSILEGSPVFLTAQKAFSAQDIYQIEGDLFKRPRYREYPDSLREWLERRNISLNAESHDFELLFSPGLSEKLIANLKLLAPMYRFLLETALREQREGTALELLQRS